MSGDSGGKLLFPDGPEEGLQHGISMDDLLLGIKSFGEDSLKYRYYHVVVYMGVNDFLLWISQKIEGIN